VADGKENEKLSIGEGFRIHCFRRHARGCWPKREGTSRELSQLEVATPGGKLRPSQLGILKLEI
jgi:hypothetical protein